MSRYIGGAFCEPGIDEEPYFDELTQEEILAIKVEEHIANEEIEENEIKETYRRLYYEE